MFSRSIASARANVQQSLFANMLGARNFSNVTLKLVSVFLGAPSLSA